jgi:transcriptional regulator with XRE-family HTH domain
MMELQTETAIDLESLPNEPLLNLSIRAKTSHRMHYEAQVEVIKKQVGDLETVRSQLGLTQRKMAQLLMVDPSAWTRWTRQNDQAPPHIFRALQWYMTLQEKIPGLTPQYFIGKDPEVLNRAVIQRLEGLEARNSELRAQKEDLEARVGLLSHQVQANRVGFFMVVIGALIMALALYWRLRG